MLNKADRRKFKSGFTMVEVVISSGILVIAFVAFMSSMISAMREASANTLRTVALFTAEQTIEELRSVGKDDLLSNNTWTNQLSGTNTIWVYDPIADGTYPSNLMIRTGYKIDNNGVAVVDTGGDIWLTQACIVYVPDNGGLPDSSSWLTVTVDIQWTFSGKTYSDSLVTTIE